MKKKLFVIFATVVMFCLSGITVSASEFPESGISNSKGIDLSTGEEVDTTDSEVTEYIDFKSVEAIETYNSALLDYLTGSSTYALGRRVTELNDKIDRLTKLVVCIMAFLALDLLIVILWIIKLYRKLLGWEEDGYEDDEEIATDNASSYTLSHAFESPFDPGMQK